jgi:parallel beta-helix repeat protein
LTENPATVPKLKALRRNILFLKYSSFLLFISFLSFSSSGQTLNIYVAAGGDTLGTGQTAASPVGLTKAKAIAKANAQTPCTIWLAMGSYTQLTLDASDSRSAAAPVTYQSTVPNGAYFQPELPLNISNFQPIPDSIKARIINTTAKTKVMQMSLASYNFPDLIVWPAVFSIDLLRSPKFFRNGYPLPMSRYPADTTMSMRAVVTKGTFNSVPGGSFKYRDGRGQYWLHAINDGGLFLSGNWEYTWQMPVVKTLSINTADSVITQAIGLSGGLGTQDPSRIPAGTEPYYALNLVEEIGAEGQWSINFRTKMLYMWVPASGTITLSGNGGVPAILATGVSNTRFIGFGVHGGSGNGIELHSCSNVLIAGTRISDCSGNGITITDGTNCTVQSNDIDSVGKGGVVISTSSFLADQFNLKSSGHQVINNHIYAYAREAFLYSAAVDVSNAIGTYVAYNKVHDSPHVGILFGGNNNTLEYNEVYDVVKKFTDMGAFYRSGSTQAWNSRGNKINHNFIHDAPNADGVYEDGAASGDSISYNIFGNGLLSTYSNNGYFITFANNIYVQNLYPVTCRIEPSTDAAFVNYADSLRKLWNASAIYKKAYPECADMIGPSGQNKAFTSRIWPAVTGNVFVSNPGILSWINDSQLFNQDGTTNATYAQTGLPFTQYGIVVKNDFKLTGKLLKPITPFNMDSVRSTTAFDHTLGTDWHIYRIGLHKDSYRPDVSSTKTAGIDPVISLTYSSNSNLINPGIVTLTVGVKSPNASNTLPSMWFTNNGLIVSGQQLTITKKIVSFDSVTYIGVWTNPAVGTHAVNMVGGDGLWIYTSNAIGFTIKNPTTTALAVVNDAHSSGGIALEWTAPNESNVGSYQILQSRDGVNFKPLTVVTPKCNDSNRCSYSLPVSQELNREFFYRVKVLSATGSSEMTNTVRSLIDFDTRQFSLYPSPARESVNISYTSSKDQDNSSVIVYDMLGRVMLKKEISIHTGLNELTLPVNAMADGIYLLVLENRQIRMVSRNFVIRH